MDAALAGRESNFNASDDNSCNTGSDDTIHFHHTIVCDFTDSNDRIHFHHTIVCDFNGESSVWGLDIIPHPVLLSIGHSINNLGGRWLV